MVNQRMLHSSKKMPEVGPSRGQGLFHVLFHDFGTPATFSWKDIACCLPLKSRACFMKGDCVWMEQHTQYRVLKKGRKRKISILVCENPGREDGTL
jgi:hypothetical protein